MFDKLVLFNSGSVWQARLFYLQCTAVWQPSLLLCNCFKHCRCTAYKYVFTTYFNTLYCTNLKNQILRNVSTAGMNSKIKIITVVIDESISGRAVVIKYERLDKTNKKV